MRTKLFVFLLCSLLLALAGCEKRATTQPVTSDESGQFDACALLKKEEIEAIQGSVIKEMKSSEQSEGAIRVSQCFYTAAEFSQSVSLAVTQRDPKSSDKRGPRDLWKETFGRYAGEEKEREGDKEKKESLPDQTRARGEEETSTPPKKMDGIGDEAYWTANRFGGALYVLKKDAFIRISVGGADNEETKINKSKVLADKALKRL